MAARLLALLVVQGVVRVLALELVRVLAGVPERVPWTPRMAQAEVKVAALVAMEEEVVEVGLRPLRPLRLAAPLKV